MEKQLKGDFYIFPRKESLQISRLQTILGMNDNIKIIFHGKVDNLPESIAKSLCDFMFWDEKDPKNEDKPRYYNYGKKQFVSYPYLTAKASVKSACEGLEFCIIIKKLHNGETD